VIVNGSSNVSVTGNCGAYCAGGGCARQPSESSVNYRQLEKAAFHDREAAFFALTPSKKFNGSHVNPPKQIQ
jgi:hypothetical protein